MMPSLKLGIDTYSLRAWRMKALELLDYAAAQKLDAVQFGQSDFESTEPAYLAKVKDKATQLGLSVDGGIGCICPTSKSWNARNGTPAAYVSHWLEASRAIGADAMRVFVSSPAERWNGDPIEKHIEATVAVLRQVKSRAQDLRVKIAVENHGEFQAWELKALIEEAGRDFVGACLDTGNPLSVMEDPLTTIEVLGPYTLTTHVRDSVVFEHPRGAAYQWVALGDGVIDFPRFLARFAELCPAAAVHLENITGRPPIVLPYLEPATWKAFPRSPAAAFARFVALARNGRPFSGHMVITDGLAGKTPEFDAALKTQQKRDLERGFEYARRQLGLGVRARA